MILTWYNKGDGRWGYPGRCYSHIKVVVGSEELHHGHTLRVATGELQVKHIPQVFIYCASCSLDGFFHMKRMSTLQGRQKFLLLSDIMKVISSCCSLLPGGSWRMPLLGLSPLQGGSIVEVGLLWETETQRKHCNCRTGSQAQASL